MCTPAPCTLPTPSSPCRTLAICSPRRSEGVSIWVVRSSDVAASDPDDRESLFDPAADKTFRHPTDFELPDEVANM